MSYRVGGRRGAAQTDLLAGDRFPVCPRCGDLAPPGARYCYCIPGYPVRLFPTPRELAELARVTP